MNKRIDFYCSHCGSRDVRRNCDCAWNPGLQRWEVVAEFDEYCCEDCGCETDITQVLLDTEEAKKNLEEHRKETEYAQTHCKLFSNVDDNSVSNIATVELKVMLVVKVNEFVDIDDVIREMDYQFSLPDNVVLENSEIIDYEIKDS